MNIGFNLQLVQTQKLIMTPELRQAIKLLQYSNLELSSFIQKEIEENPVVENTNEAADEIRIQKMAHLYKAQRDSYAFSNSNFSEDDIKEYDYYIDKSNTLKAYLLEQLQLSEYTGNNYEIIEYLINNIDENGYLFIDEDYVMTFFKIDKKILENMIEIMQHFEPKGVGARNLKECLLLQVEGYDPKINQIIESHLEDIAYNNIDVIAKKLKISIDEVNKLIEVIRNLNPKPGSGYDNSPNEENRYIVPELNLIENGSELKIEFINEYIPHIRINSYYLNLLEKGKLDDNTKQYLNKYLKRAEHIVKCIEQRKNTILSVSSVIIDIQKDYLLKKKNQLNILTLKDIANKLEIHESTVSRAIDGKYMQTKSGILALKDLLQKPVNANVNYSAEDCMDKIKYIISLEDKRKPFSDQQIADILNEKGFCISRRTVAKYRETLNIFSSSKRKRK